MPSGRLPRGTWRTAERSCVTRTGKWRRWRRGIRYETGCAPGFLPLQASALAAASQGLRSLTQYLSSDLRCNVSQVEIKVYKQKVKHLLYEHQNNITTLKADGELALKLQQDEFRKREGELGKDKRNLKLTLKEQVRALDGWTATVCSNTANVL